MKNEIVLFENQGVKFEVNMKDESVWLNCEQLAMLFDRDIKKLATLPFSSHDNINTNKLQKKY